MAEKAEGETGWLFPVGDEAKALGYNDMFTDMLDSLENDRLPMESFYDGYVVNAIMDAAYESVRSKQWAPVLLEEWRGAEVAEDSARAVEYDEAHILIKEEKMPDGRKKLILREKASGRVVQKIIQ